MHNAEQFVEDIYGPEYYANPENYPQWDSDIRLSHLLSSRIRAIARLKPQRGELLDVGTGLGHFMEAARADGWVVTGVEPSRHARESAKLRSSATVHSRVSELLPSARFDCVTLWDVLEHDPDPLHLLTHLGELMRSGALLAVSMPNLGGLEARLRGSSWRFFRSEFGHMTHHSPNSLSRMLHRVGYEVVSLQTEGSLNLSGRLHAVLPDALVESVQSVSDRAVSTLGLGRNMTAYARRR